MRGSGRRTKTAIDALKRETARRFGSSRLGMLLRCGVMAALVSPFMAGCGERPQSLHPSYDAAERAGLVKQGWIPSFVPRTATDLAEVHDIDTNEQRLAFAAPVGDLEAMVEGMSTLSVESVRASQDDLPPLKGRRWPEILSRRNRAGDSLVGTGLYRDEASGRCVAIVWAAQTAYTWTCSTH